MQIEKAPTFLQQESSLPEYSKSQLNKLIQAIGFDYPSVRSKTTALKSDPAFRIYALNSKYRVLIKEENGYIRLVHIVLNLSYRLRKPALQA